MKQRTNPHKARAEFAQDVFHTLRGLHADAHIELDFSNPLELLIATILSAQCTDKRVNIVTKTLFSRCKTLRDYLDLPQSELEEIVQSTGFFRQKAKSIRGAVEQIAALGGKVPETLDELVKLPGVGRKTANVVLGNAFGKPGLPVDTHVKRLVNRLGISDETDPVAIELELHQLLPPEQWTLFSHTLIFHGRRICDARRPKCAECPAIKLCRHAREHAL